MMRGSVRPYMCCLFALSLLCGCGKKKDSDKQLDQVYEVTRGSFNIVISANGTLDAIKRYNIEAPPVSKKGLDIIEAVEDQTPLKKGDLIVAFSDENYLDELESQEIKIEEGEKNLMLVEQDYQMKTADSVSLIKKATDTRRDCVEDLEKYINEDAPLQKKNLQLAVEDARIRVEEEKENLASLKEDLLTASMGDEAARTKIEDQIETSKEKIEDLEAGEEKAIYNLRMFKQYTYPQKSRQLEQNLVKAEMDLQKQLVNATSQRIQLERKIDSQKQVLKTQRKQREDLLENIAMLKVTAPVDGVVSYGNPDPRRRNQQQKDITVGTSMRPSELIGTIPDLSRLVVNLDVPEAVRSKIDIGMRAEMRIKALPNVRLSGEVTKIADMASHLNFWDRTSPKIYPTVISLDEHNAALRPGMSVEVDMISEEVHDVVFVPVEALFAKEGSIYCRVHKSMRSEERNVKIGRSSSSFVEITEGLEPGEKVLLIREEL
ncbi:efflux RND transporter periplasmic adaptor subunit [Tichowtungia aerotolerans]|uniref:HlyD family efflux transporter periplasmic adaptor subunit n=1 Tax=Tichowtungia aerotolerans TaxID=2697043 RepID=A0A6P1M442_9BACT|nr:efflux RND transporter periplasmic adaptor subunit [Tichowtungia aerotolerans]QHI69609.1 HlyD family efflux transporter periplasmic adaptor subunit [Tichowtungia aerotolerans]